MTQPNFADQLWAIGNEITKTIMVPCAQNPMVYVKLAGKITGEVFLVLIDIDPYSMLRGYTRPKSLRGEGRIGDKDEPREGIGEDGEEHPFWKDGIPDVGQEIGKVLPGSDFFQGRVAGDAESILWHTGNKVWRGAWYMFIAELGVDGYMDWQAAVCKMKCNKKEAPVNFSGATDVYEGSTMPLSILGTPPPPASSGINAFGTSAIGFTKPTSGVVYWSLDIDHAPVSTDENFQKWILSAYVNGVKQPLDSTEMHLPKDPTTPGNYIWSGTHVMLFANFDYADGLEWDWAGAAFGGIRPNKIGHVALEIYGEAHWTVK